MWHVLELYPDLYEQAIDCLKAFEKMCIKHDRSADLHACRTFTSSLKSEKPDPDEPRRYLVDQKEIELLASACAVKYLGNPGSWSEMRNLQHILEQKLGIKLL
jgi:hypothetical protein